MHTHTHTLTHIHTYTHRETGTHTYTHILLILLVLVLVEHTHTHTGTHTQTSSTLAHTHKLVVHWHTHTHTHTHTIIGLIRTLVIDPERTTLLYRLCLCRCMMLIITSKSDDDHVVCFEKKDGNSTKHMGSGSSDVTTKKNHEKNSLCGHSVSSLWTPSLFPPLSIFLYNPKSESCISASRPLAPSSARKLGQPAESRAPLVVISPRENECGIYGQTASSQREPQQEA